MDIFPIWKTTYYTSNAQDAVFRILKDSEVIYRARARRMPDESVLRLNLNKACQSTLDSILIPSDTEDNVERQNAYAEFKLQTLNETSGQWIDTYDFAFYNDWSYDPNAPQDCLNAPINAHAAPGQIITLTQLVTGNSEQVCYELYCPEPGPTPPTPPDPPTPPTPDTGDTSGYPNFTVISGGTLYWMTSQEKQAGESESKVLQYSKDRGITWNYLYPRSNQTGANSVSLAAGETIIFKGSSRSYGTEVGEYGATVGICSFVGSDSLRMSLSGNIRALCPYDNPDPYTFRGLFSRIYAMPSNAYNNTFTTAQNLVLPYTSVKMGMYASMFSRCSALAGAPALPATSIAAICYQGMFEGCSALATAPSLPATVVYEGSYDYMFSDCISLTSAPALPATTLARACYQGMFAVCRYLTSAPALPATTLANACYASMFFGCRYLTTAPDLPAAVGTDMCYYCMFEGCSNLSYVKCLLERKFNSSTESWLNGVAASGTFVKASGMQDWGTGSSEIPTNWTVESV